MRSVLGSSSAPFSPSPNNEQADNTGTNKISPRITSPARYHPLLLFCATFILFPPLKLLVFLSKCDRHQIQGTLCLGSAMPREILVEFASGQRDPRQHKLHALPVLSAPLLLASHLDSGYV